MTSICTYPGALVKRRQIASKTWDKRSETVLIGKERISKYRKAIGVARLTKARKALKREYLIVHNNLCGGSHKWSMELRMRLGIASPFISRLAQLEQRLAELSAQVPRVQIVLVINYFIATDITAKDIIDLSEKYSLTIVIPIHDWYWFRADTDHTVEVHNIYLHKDFGLRPTTLELFKRAASIICPTSFVYNLVKSVYAYSNVIREGWVDNAVGRGVILTRLSKDKGINLGVLVDSSEYKGSEQVSHLKQRCQDVNILRVGIEIERYEEELESFLTLIKNHNIHGLLYLNKWGETWCYGLTKGLFSGLPIFYNDIGSFKERIPKDQDKYVINNSDEAQYYDYCMLETNFERFVSFIRENDVFLSGL